MMSHHPTLRAAVRSASDSVVDPCEICGKSNAGESDPQAVFEWLCESCHLDRKPVAAPSAWDVAFDSAHADREDR